MTECTENKFDSMTVEELSKSLFDNHLQKVKEQLDHYDEIKKNDIKASFIYPYFKEMLNGTDYLLWNSQDRTKDHLLDGFLKEIAKEIEFTQKLDDDLRLRYLMEKYVGIIKILHAEAVWDVKHERRRNPLPVFKIDFEPKVPMFVCGECEKRKELEENRIPNGFFKEYKNDQ